MSLSCVRTRNAWCPNLSGFCQALGTQGQLDVQGPQETLPPCVCAQTSSTQGAPWALLLLG